MVGEGLGHRDLSFLAAMGSTEYLSWIAVSSGIDICSAVEVDSGLLLLFPSIVLIFILSPSVRRLEISITVSHPVRGNMMKALQPL